MTRLKLNKISSKEKNERIMNRLNITNNNHKNKENFKKIQLKLLNKNFALTITHL